jgi:hypothetical protein
MLEYALERSYDVRMGLEDTLAMPTAAPPGTTFNWSLRRWSWPRRPVGWRHPAVEAR